MRSRNLEAKGITSLTDGVSVTKMKVLTVAETLQDQGLSLRITKEGGARAVRA